MQARVDAGQQFHLRHGGAKVLDPEGAGAAKGVALLEAVGVVEVDGPDRALGDEVKDVGSRAAQPDDPDGKAGDPPRSGARARASERIETLRVRKIRSGFMLAGGITEITCLPSI